MAGAARFPKQLVEWSGGLGSAALAVLCGAFLVLPFQSQPVSAEKPGKAVLLTINDVYRLKGINDGNDGGLPRVRALRAELERDAPDLLLLHAGDFLSPSFLGRTYKGEQMIDLMNVLDGDPVRGTIDPRMFVAFGNHEFDDSHCKKKGPLASLVAESEFTWLAANLDFSKCAPLQELAGSPRIAPSRIVESGGLRVGIYGVTLSRSKYAAIVSDPVATSCAQVKELRSKGADVVVALTHLAWQTDLSLLGLDSDSKPVAENARTCSDMPDVVVGGHDHVAMNLPSKNPRLFKADADALSAWVIELSKDANGKVQITSRLVALDASRKPDALAERLADQWLVRHDEQFCARDCLSHGPKKRKACMAKVTNGACLREPIAQTASLIETEELANRSSETGFGNWIADRVRVAGGADVAFLNAGGIRLNYNIAPGTMITRRHLAQMFPFKNKLAIRDVPGKVLWKAMEQAVKKRGEGAWAHFSGMVVRLEGEGGRQVLSQILVRRRDGTLLKVGPDMETPIKLASISFVLANGDGHGFALCPNESNIWACKSAIEKTPDWPLVGEGRDLTGFLLRELRIAGKDTSVSFSKDGRLCDPRQSDCLIDRWQKKP